MTQKVQHMVQVAAALICKNGRYLIAQRQKGTHLEGLWEFPGGKREAGESLEACVRREVWEELGIALTEPLPFAVHHYTYPEKSVELHFFTCDIEHGTPKSLGCAQFAWVKPDELAAYEFPPADRPVVDQLMSMEVSSRTRD